MTSWPDVELPTSTASASVDHALAREIRAEVSDRLAAELARRPVVDPAARRELARSLLSEVLSQRAVRRVHDGQPAWSVDEEFALADAVIHALFGLGRLQPLIEDQDVENVEANGCDQVWVSYADGRERRAGAIADTDDEMVEMIQAVVARTGQAERTFTTASPSVHLRLEDGSRLAAMAWTTPRPQLVIRRHRIRDIDLDDLVRFGTLDPVLAAFLRAALLAGKNIVVTGLQNAGKTTLIRALANEFGPMERFATIEREYELLLHEMPDRHPRVVAMEARAGSSERDARGHAAGEVTLSDLVVDALRMNLRRIIVGEVRGSEVLPMLQAMATGDGSLCTVHSRSAGKAFDRIVTLCLTDSAGMSDAFAYRLAAGAIDLIVHIALLDESAQGGRRHRFVSDVLEIDGIGEAGRPVTTHVFAPGQDGRAVPTHHPRCLPELQRAGFDAGLLEHRTGLWTQPLVRVERTW
jgi:Flp pilus assembly CpaF family ATPase